MSSAGDTREAALAWMAAHINHGWTQGEYARTQRGLSTPPSSVTAESWCLVGASMATRTQMGGRRFLTSKETYWNDAPERTQEDVLSYLSDLYEEATV